MKRAHNAVDLTGLRFGRLTVLELAGKDARHTTLWKCRCDCGTEIVCRSTNLRSGCTSSCGCLRDELRIVIIRNFLYDRTLQDHGGYDSRREDDY
jgi:hypothetical protein